MEGVSGHYTPRLNVNTAHIGGNLQRFTWDPTELCASCLFHCQCLSALGRRTLFYTDRIAFSFFFFSFFNPLLCLLGLWFEWRKISTEKDTVVRRVCGLQTCTFSLLLCAAIEPEILIFYLEFALLLCFAETDLNSILIRRTHLLYNGSTKKRTTC